VQAQGASGGIERAGGERFEGHGHITVEKLATRRQEPRVHHLADAVVREVEALIHPVQHPPPHQLLHAPGGFAVGKPAGPPQEREVELAADDGRHRE